MISLKAAGLEANAGLIRVYNLPENDRGPTDHEAVAVIKPTGTEEAQVAVMCADSAHGIRGYVQARMRCDHADARRQ